MSALKKFVSTLDRALTGRARVILVAGALMLIPTYFVPMWGITLTSNQYPEGLRLYIYPHRLGSGHAGNDLREINVLNHYIGMRDLKAEDFAELEWIPFVIGAFVVFGLRAAVMGKVGTAVDLLVTFAYFGAFSLGSFYHKLYLYGHTLNPRAAMDIEPFTPPLIGSQQLANFHVVSLPQPGTFLMLAFIASLIAALVLSVRAGTDDAGAA